LNKHPQKKQEGLEKFIRVIVFHFVDATHDSTEEGFVFVLPGDFLFHEGEGTRVVVHTPVEEQKRHHDGVKLQVVLDVREWHDHETHEQKEVNRENYIHLY
jgi:hypothetical protein